MGGASEAPLALVAIIQGDIDRALRLAESSRQASEERQDQHNLAFAHYALSAAKLALGEHEASKKHAQKAAALTRQLGNRWFLGYPLNEWGKAALALGDRAEARRQFQASFTIKSEFNDAEGMAVALNHLGDIARLQGEFSRAQDTFERSLRIYRTLNDHGGLATSYRGLARVALSRDAIGEACNSFLKSLKIAHGIHYLPLIFSLLVDVAPLLCQLGECSLAVRLLSFVQQDPASDNEARLRASRQLKNCEPQLPSDEFNQACQQGEAWELDDAIATLQTALATAQTQAEPLGPAGGELIEELTAREEEVLALMAEGLSNAQIAEELVLAVGTVKWYASEIYGKLGVANRTEAAARAHKLKLV
jgi:ATP/maltotriose-dependent transcriptional regulator MalT